MEDVCRAFVNSLETLAVAVDASAMGLTGGGLRNDGLAASFCFCFSRDTGLFSRMFRRYETVRSTCKSSDEDELEADGSSTIGGVSQIRRPDAGEQFVESRLAEREAGKRGDRDWRGFRVAVDVLVLVEPLRFLKNDEGDAVDDVDPEVSFGGFTTEESISIARLGRSLSEPTACSSIGRLEKGSEGSGVIAG